MRHVQGIHPAPYCQSEYYAPLCEGVSTLSTSGARHDAAYCRMSVLVDYSSNHTCTHAIMLVQMLPCVLPTHHDVDASHPCGRHDFNPNRIRMLSFRWPVLPGVTSTRRIPMLGMLTFMPSLPSTALHTPPFLHGCRPRHTRHTTYIRHPTSCLRGLHPCRSSHTWPYSHPFLVSESTVRRMPVTQASPRFPIA